MIAKRQLYTRDQMTQKINCRSLYGLRLASTEQLAINGPEMAYERQLKEENKRSN